MNKAFIMDLIDELMEELIHTESTVRQIEIRSEIESLKAKLYQ